MFTRGNAKHPCTRLTSIRGFAVRPIRPYCLNRYESSSPIPIFLRDISHIALGHPQQ